MHSVSYRLRIKPPALRSGDTVCIVAPASNIQPGLLEKGCDTLRNLGYKPFYFDSIFDQDFYFAGSISRRAREFQEMIMRDDVRAILCARGGYGSNSLLSVLDLGVIGADPKILVGDGDLSTILDYITDSSGV